VRPTDVKLPAPIAGFIGHINSRIDFQLLEAIAGRSLSVLLVGPRNTAFEPERWAKLLERPNVQWVGPKPFESLSGYLRVIDVGLVPYGDSAFNRGSFPLKTLEYLAAGRPVVSTSLPATRWLNTNLIAVADAPDAYADAVEFWARRPRRASDIAVRQAFARDHDWAARARAMVQVIDDALKSKDSPT
jgi:teichuronic acid biosynthesis glycosyltransferase TuaH